MESINQRWPLEEYVLNLLIRAKSSQLLKIKKIKRSIDVYSWPIYKYFYCMKKHGAYSLPKKELPFKERMKSNLSGNRS